ncbi:putative lipid II flippase FtsW [Desulfobotulus sp. H1]|uniref:Probable peptidoglycan glycosyltransferase FtsW n=1 Tax=Desulfobotulus pelophilus TaxID=2823377 RepID=A0ABT3N517_9BACT|nr:putative lipid II flippase FtsW [Desulfobotulus pelophilus]MCW7752555.1 putative lipid II flippase FtsW [Desulfobotulus pelophilus]
MSRHPNHKISFREDPWLWAPVLILMATGLVMVYSASASRAALIFGSEYHFLSRQAVHMVAGFGILILFRFFPYRFLAGLAYPILALAFAFLIAVLFSQYGHSAGGAQRWLHLGPVSFQPSEMAKYALIIYMAYSLNKKQEQIHLFSIGFLPHFVVLMLFAVLLMQQPDFGSILILMAIAWMLMFLAGVPFLHLAWPAIPLAGILTWIVYAAPYRMRRILSFTDPWAHAQDEGFQVSRALMAFGNGGPFGQGLGNGRMKMDYIPESHTDFIFAVIGEEMGLWGVCMVLCLFVILFLRSMQAAMSAPDRFGLYLGAGIAIALAMQVLINTGVTLGMLPPKGLTLPFLSYGGTSLVVNLAAMGIIMNIAATGRKA